MEILPDKTYTVCPYSYLHTMFPPLTAQEARDIYAAERTEHMRRVLWEVARLQALILEAHQILALGLMSGTWQQSAVTGSSAICRTKIEQEPAYLERKRRQAMKDGKY